MGNTCGGMGGRLPSSLRLCQELASGSPWSPTSTRPIFEFCSPQELGAMGEVIDLWAKGRLSGPEAKRLLQVQVFGSTIFAGASRTQGSHPFEGVGMLVTVGNNTSAGLSVVMLTPQRSVAHPFMDFVDQLLVQSASVQDGYGLVVREVGLDGPRPLVLDMKVRFRELVDGIFSNSTRRAAQPGTPGVLSESTRLELLKVCLCMEVLRHVCPPVGGVPPPPPPRMLANDERAVHQLQGVSPGPGGTARLGSHMVPQHSRGSAIFAEQMRQDMLRRRGSWRTIDRDSVTVTRLNHAMLQLRIISLLESVVQNTGLERREHHRGLDLLSIERMCPSTRRGEADSENVGETCCVCLEPLAAGQELRALPCDHVLHKECCEAWLMRVDSCPVCRASVLPDGIMV
mmetsp:Transcript_106923/g.300663  ORF Transcript_106923/g.300663 Transcript_106923/m.300663 type:complete len:400 (+) Transcript_106923:55-1254(+)|eukprot:CAMPEP_0117556488 /NCGR_PEP_ID=MMETSP0784-20121206/51835_1 /TAXON_ID=39447 /ORGANISM="" /LENGTH=399 /DNA_ID=CAMNT_0005353765 /DNA_START=1 /DNA_END=1200 /DNA_ORIENTATION=+